MYMYMLDDDWRSCLPVPYQAAGTNLDLLVKQIVEFKPKLVCIQKGEMIDELRNKLTSSGWLFNSLYKQRILYMYLLICTLESNM